MCSDQSSCSCDGESSSSVADAPKVVSVLVNTLLGPSLMWTPELPCIAVMLETHANGHYIANRNPPVGHPFPGLAHPIIGQCVLHRAGPIRVHGPNGGARRGANMGHQ